MNKTITELKVKLAKCRNTLIKGYTSTTNSGMKWLNEFCAEFLEFTNYLHKFLVTELAHVVEVNEHVANIFLCLKQVTTCVMNMERTIKAEEIGGMAISASRQHFLDRIHWCLERLRAALKSIANTQALTSNPKKLLEQCTFVELMDNVFELLEPYCSYAEGDDLKMTNVAKENAEAMFASQQIRCIIDLILGHTLAFANVALKEDKKALSALCQKVLRECTAFQEECVLNQKDGKLNNSVRKLKAISLESAIYRLEDFMNESLLRLVYTVFLDYEKFSIEKLRAVLHLCEHDEQALDELIADFDVNVDRTMQIGMFAIAFAPNLKLKTTVRSCLASMESLDAALIPSLYTKHAASIHSELLEQHFNEEVERFKYVMQEIIDSHAFIVCYQELLNECITQVEKEFKKTQLREIVQQGEFLCAHFKLKINQQELAKEAQRLECFEKFEFMLRECQAVLMCADQVDPSRILKRFKILRCTLRKLEESLCESSKRSQGEKSEIFLLSEELSDSQRMFESMGISPTICSILYCKEPAMRRRATSDSLKGNYSKLPASPQQQQQQQKQEETIKSILKIQENSKPTTSKQLQLHKPCTVRRKESLRTAMFKRQKSNETEKVYSIYKNNSTNLHITEILEQLSSVTAK